jgi:hypothetical protein
MAMLDDEISPPEFIKGGKYTVSKPAGLELRMEPSVNSQTKKKDNNIICILPVGTIVVLENKRTRPIAQQKWCKVSYETWDNKIKKREIGWVVADGLALASTFIVKLAAPVQIVKYDPVETTATPPVKNIKYNGERKYTAVTLKSTPDEVVLGAVEYTTMDGQLHRTSRKKWNVAAPKNKI